MMLKSLFIAAIALMAVSCAPKGYEPYLTRGLNTDKREIHDQFTLERTACYGFCPVYKVTVDERDILEFQGKRFVKETGGSVILRLPEGAYKQLLDIARAHDFASFDRAYPNEDASNCPRIATDSPSVIVGFVEKDRSRTVSVYQGCIGFEGRERFDAMLAAMDAVLGIDDLIGPREDFDGAKE